MKDILEVTKNVALDANLGFPFTIYDGTNVHYPFPNGVPYVLMTLTDFSPSTVVADGSRYSWIDFLQDPSEGVIYNPWINVIPSQRNGGRTARTLNRIMERVAREMYFGKIIANNIANERLEKNMPGLGYRPISGKNGYFEKRIV